MIKNHRRNYNLPNFIGIGVAKSGTTWLSEILRAHPQIFIPPEKELVFFSSEENYKNGINWYLDFFKDASPSQISGEFSVDYLASGHKTAKRIYEFNKNIKLILMVRNPVERAISHYRFLKQINKKTNTFVNEIRLNGSPASHSLYYKNFLPFTELFPREQYHIIRYDDIVTNPKSIQKSVYRFLGVCSDIDSGVTKKVIGKTINPRFIFLEKLRLYLFESARKNNLAFFIPFSKKIGLSSLYRKLNHNEYTQEKITNDEKMIAYNCFIEDMLKFSKLTGIDVSSWIMKND